jgi:hypothetical protein
LKHNLDTDVDPTPNHAERGGYAVGSMWRNRLTGRCFVCADASDNGAKWVVWGEAPVQSDGLAKVAHTGRYSDLDGVPSFGEAAGRGVGAGRGNVAPGDDPRIVGALQREANLGDLDDVGEAQRNLGLNDLVLRLLSADSIPAVLKVLGLSDVARRRHIEALQPKHEALTHLSGIKVGAAGVDLMRADDRDDVREYLGLVPGDTVQRHSNVLDAVARMEPAVLGLLLASNLAAVRGLLELEPGQKFGPPMEWAALREVLTTFRRDLDEVRAWFGAAKSGASAAL